jgi:hypothetical protein
MQGNDYPAQIHAGKVVGAEEWIKQGEIGITACIELCCDTGHCKPYEYSPVAMCIRALCLMKPNQVDSMDAVMSRAVEQRPKNACNH